ncbi:hypothetical protein Scep_012662 [Stephania cephalantha]|uniref:Uncharacterized protein n=1 Tax=Stephania cephalantha TaxID=152367 RepID=A0AAP0P7R7_9MAGN
MGASLCGCRTIPKEDDSIDGSKISVTPEINNNRFSACSRTEKMKKNNTKREYSMRHQTNKVIAKKRTFTLEDWLLNSPGFKPEHFNRGSGELHAFRQHYRSRVHPSSTTNTMVSNPSVASEASDETVDFSVDRVLDAEDQLFNVVGSPPSLSRSLSGKIKKKVSFKMPQESDIIIFHSPD